MHLGDSKVIIHTPVCGSSLLTSYSLQRMVDIGDIGALMGTSQVDGERNMMADDNILFDVQRHIKKVTQVTGKLVCVCMCVCLSGVERMSAAI